MHPACPPHTHVPPLPTGAASLPADHPLRAAATEAVARAHAAYGAMDFSGAAEAVNSISSRGNQFLEEQQPWTKLKKVGGGGRGNGVGQGW